MLAAFFWLTGIYLGVGLLFALYFVRRGVERLDETAIGAPWGFRLMILPGCVALWPVLLTQLLSNKEDPA